MLQFPVAAEFAADEGETVDEVIPLADTGDGQPASPALEEIIVYGEKLQRSQLETSSSVAVISGATIEQQGLDTFEDLLGQVANTLAIGDKERGRLSIRGINRDGADGLGFFSPLITTYVDGVPLDANAILGGLNTVFDVEQVEVLRGAQSTAQGRNSLAGSVLIKTNDPSEHWEFDGRMKASKSQTQQIAMAGGGPLSSTLNFRLASQFDTTDGEISNPTLNIPNWSATEQHSIRGKLQWAPQAWPDLLATLTLADAQTDTAPLFNFITDDDGIAFRRIALDNLPHAGRLRSQLASLITEYEISDRHRLVFTTAAVRSQRFEFFDADRTEDDGGFISVPTGGKNLSQELRLDFDGLGSSPESFWGQVRGTAGLFIGRFDERLTILFRDLLIPVSTAVNAPGAENVEGRVDTDQDQRRLSNNVAVFAEMDIPLTSTITANFGFRYDREVVDLTYLFDVTRAELFLADNAPPGTDLSLFTPDDLNQGAEITQILAETGLLPSSDGVQMARTRFEAFLPKLGVRYAPSPTWNLFFTYSEAYRAGGADVLRGFGENAGQLNEFDPEFTRNYEIGFRLELSSFRLGSNIYHIDWRDQQVDVPDPNGDFDFITQNAANSRLYGAELEWQWQATAALGLRLSLGTNRTKFIDFQSGEDDFSGNEFIAAPRFSGSLTAHYQWRNGFFVSGSFTGNSSYFSTAENAADQQGNARQLLGFNIGWRHGAWSVRAFGKNLLDQDYDTQAIRVRTGTTFIEDGRLFNYGERVNLGAQIRWQLQ